MKRPSNHARQSWKRGSTASQNDRGAFTLVELLSVMVIIAILLALIVGLGAYAKEAMRRARAKAQLEIWQNAAVEMNVKYGSYPSSPTGTNAYGVNGFWATCPELVKLLKQGITGTDPWGNEYRYFWYNDQSCVFMSCGRNTNASDTDDDIYSGSGMR